MADFTRYEYDQQLQRMTTILSEAPGWGEGYESSMGQTLIQLMADVTDHLHFMLERRTIENYIISARLRSSIITRASEMGYRLRRSIANSGYIRVQLQDDEGNPVVAQDEITLPVMTPISSEDGIDYVTAEDLVIQAGDTYGDVLVKQAQVVSSSFQTIEETFVNDHYVLIRDYENIENELFFVRANGNRYQDVTRSMAGASPTRRALSFAGPDDYFYDIRYTVEGMRLLFGDGTFGNKPTSTITVDYASVVNDEPLLVTGQSFSFSSASLFDIDDNEYSYQASNITQIRGGSLAETNESIKNNAIAYHKTNGRAVSPDDYEYWTRQSGIGNIIDASVAGEHELDTMVYNANNVYINYLTATGDEINENDHRALIDYFSSIKTSGVHLVISPVDVLKCKINMWPVRGKTLPISNSELYSILHRFLLDYFALTEGSIGREIQQSDLIDAMYDLRVTRSGIEYRVVDFVRVDIEAVYPFSYPERTNNVAVRIADAYSPTDGDEFILLIDGTPVMVTAGAGDDKTALLLKMRDEILANFGLRCNVELLGVTVDGSGYPVPLGLSGETQLYGFVTVTDIEPNVVVNRRYFGARVGAKEIIPVYDTTTFSVTAPSDAAIEIRGRTSIRQSDTESVITTVAAGQTYNFTNTNQWESVQFFFNSDTLEEIDFDVVYPNGDGIDLAMRVQTLDGFGQLEIASTPSSAVDSHIDFLYTIDVPKKSRTITESTRNIMEGTLKLCDPDGTVVYTTTPAGDFLDSSGNVVGGFVDHRSGEIVVPNALPAGDYIFMYQQDKWQNLVTDEFSAIQLIDPKPTFTSTDFSLSTIELE